MKRYNVIFLILFFVWILVACNNNTNPVQELTDPTTTEITTERTHDVTGSEPWSGSGEGPPMPSADLTSKVQKTVQWMSKYVKENKEKFQKIVDELVEKKLVTWSVYNFGNGFPPEALEVPDDEWELLSVESKTIISEIDRDCRTEFGNEYQTSFFFGKNEDSTFSFSFDFSEPYMWECVKYELIFLGKGSAPFYTDKPNETPYKKVIGDWYYYCDVN
jgi:hypothetical protein